MQDENNPKPKKTEQKKKKVSRQLCTMELLRGIKKEEEKESKENKKEKRGGDSYGTEAEALLCFLKSVYIRIRRLVL